MLPNESLDSDRQRPHYQEISNEQGAYIGVKAGSISEECTDIDPEHRADSSERSHSWAR